MTSNLKLRRGWITWPAKTPATSATSRDVAPAPVPIDDALAALARLRFGEVYLVAGSSVFHDARCDRVVAAFEAGKAITVAGLADVGRRKRCAACEKLAVALDEAGGE